MLNKFFKFLKGYVIIAIYGKNPERFINICLRRKIEIWDVSPKNAVGSDNVGGDVAAMTLKISKKDFGRIRAARRKAGVGIKILKRCGLYDFLKRYRKRYMFAVCAVLCVWAVYAVSQRIWTIEINGVKNADINTLAAQLADNGVVIGAKKKDLKSIGEIKKDIIINNDDIAWLWIYFDGTKARVEVSETRMPTQTADESEPCDIVAVSDGVISSVSAKQGEATVTRGDAVERGDVLISGKIGTFREGDPEEYMYVHALGTVTAYTIHIAEREEKLYNEIRKPTGNLKRYMTLEIFGKRYNLYSEKNTDYKDYDIKTECHELILPIFGYIGIALTIEQNLEVTTERYPIDEETALECAKDKLKEEIANELTLFAELQSERVEYEKTDDETIKVRCAMSFTESIGAEEEIKE